MERSRTLLYFVRHAESVYVPGMERERGLTEKGKADAIRIADILQEEGIELLFSSPYVRAIETLTVLAERLDQEILVVEDLRERDIGRIPGNGFHEAKKRVYKDFSYSYPEGESSRHAQERAAAALEGIFQEYRGRRLGVGTHGDIMTLMMNEADKRYGYDFWRKTSMPDIYKLQFHGTVLETVERLWSSSGET